MISTEDFIKWALRSFMGLCLGVIGYFLISIVDDLKQRPTEARVNVLINYEISAIKEDMSKDRERIIRVEQALNSLVLINSKLDNMDNKLDKACEDIASIKAKRN